MAGWLRRSFHRKLVLAFCLTSLLGIALTSFLVGGAVRTILQDELTVSLTTTASVVGAEVDKSQFVTRDSRRLQEKARYLAEACGARVTFVARDGTVLGDSSVLEADLGKLENHLDRPEVRAAMSGQPVGVVRLSHTVHERMLYVAVPARLAGETVGVVRAALPLTKIEKKISRIQRRTAMVTLVILLVTLFVALGFASSISRPVSEMADVAGRLATGDYSARIQSTLPDEHGRLGDTLNLLAERVQSKIQELSRDKAQLSAILSNMTEAVVAMDATGRIIAVNSALSRMFSVDAPAAVGKMFIEVLRHHQLEQLVRGVQTERKPAIEEVRTFAPDERVFEAQAVPLNEDGQFSGVLVVLHDITRLRRLEQVRRDFVANVSHELRTPLASIKGFAETLEMGAMDDPKNRVDFLQSIQKQADGMTSLVEDLLDLTAIESGQREPNRQPAALSDIIDDVILSLRPLAGRRKVELTVSLPADLPPADVDRNQIRQVFANLIENAVKFNREGGRVAVELSVAGEWMQIRVSDTGIGIPSQDLPRVFERFYRVDKARSREMGGTGLGLSIVKHIVDAHGGAVSVESAQGKGTTFTVRLPLVLP